MSACIVPGCTNREGEGRFEGPLCSPCAIGFRSNGKHEHDAASKLIAKAARLAELEEKILDLGREAKAVTACDRCGWVSTECVCDVAALREIGNRLALFEEGGKYCRTCGEKSSWDAIKARDPDAQNHAEWCAVPEWLKLVPEDNALPLRFRIEVPRRHGMSRGHGTTWYAQGPEERDA